MNKVLVVAYAFPPVGGAGVQRPVKFVKYLREFGWEPLVMTGANPSVPVLDNALLKDIPDGVRIFRARTLEPSYTAKQSFAKHKPGIWSIKSIIKKTLANFMLPDLQILWWPGLVAEMIKVIRREKPDCLWVSAPPFSSFIPVMIVGKIFSVPVVLDYRDEWSFSRTNWENLSKNRLAFTLDTLLERFVLGNCHAFTVASQSYIAGISARYGAATAAKGTVITNGYDPDDLAGNDLAHPTLPDAGKITIVYAGTVWSATSLGNFCTALTRLLDDQTGLKQVLKFKIFGRIVDSERGYLETAALHEIVECHGYIDHELAVREMCRADILLITLSNLPGAEKIITGKAFEYMAAGKHIFAVVPEGETRRVLQENYNKLTVADAGSPQEIMAGLAWLVTHGEKIRHDLPTDVSRFSRIRLTGLLAAVLNKTIQRHL